MVECASGGMSNIQTMQLSRLREPSKMGGLCIRHERGLCQSNIMKVSSLNTCKSNDHLTGVNVNNSLANE
eukprot:scaffold6280_cov127-Skeletonema_marinoi.AAC.3